MGLKDPVNTLVTLPLGPRDPTLILDFEISPTCKFKPDGSGYALDPPKPGHGKLSGQQQPCNSCCSTPTSPTTTEPGHSVPDNGMERTSGRSTFQVHPELETDYNRPLQEMGLYDAQTTLSPVARDDLAWWLGQLKWWNSWSFIVRQPEVVIQLNASL